MTNHDAVNPPGPPSAAAGASGHLGMLAKSSFFGLFSEGLMLALGFVNGYLGIRILGTDGYGFTTTALTIISLLYTIGRLGLEYSNQQKVIEHLAKGEPGRAANTFKINLLITGAISGVLTLVFIFVVPWLSQVYFPGQPRFKVFLYGFTVIIFLGAGGDLVARTLQAVKKINEMILLQSLLRPSGKFILYLGLYLALLLYGAFSVDAFVVGSEIIFYSAMLLIGIFWLRKTPVLSDKTFSLRTPVGGFILQGLPLFFYSTLWFFITWTDLLLLGYLRDDPSLVGFYNIAARLAIIVFAFGNAINRGLIPVMGELYFKGRREELTDYYAATTKWSLIFGVAVFTALCLGGKHVLAIFAPAAADVYPALCWLAAGRLAVCASGFPLSFIYTVGRFRLVMWNNVFLFAMNLALNLWFIPKWGVLGAGAATGTSLIVAYLALFLQTRIIYKLNPYNRHNLKVLLVLLATAAAAIAVSQILSLSLPWLVVLALLYFALTAALILASGLSPLDREIAKKIKDRLLPPA